MRAGYLHRGWPSAISRTRVCSFFFFFYSACFNLSAGAVNACAHKMVKSMWDGRIKKVMGAFTLLRQVYLTISSSRGTGGIHRGKPRLFQDEVHLLPQVSFLSLGCQRFLQIYISVCTLLCVCRKFLLTFYYIFDKNTVVRTVFIKHSI